MNLDSILPKLTDIAIAYGPQLLMAILTLLIGFWVIGIAARVLQKGLEKSKVELSLQKFLGSLVSVMLKIMLLVSVASMIGIETTSFVAIIGAAGLAVGLALQGSLANFAGGVLVLLFKPYKVGDYVEAQGVSGTVRAIQVFNTVITTGDNKTIIVPNGAISNGVITNYSSQATRRVDMTFGIGYEDDISKAKALLKKLISEDSRILDTPEPVVVVAELADSSVNFTMRAWCKASDYWDIYYDMQEKVKLTFDEAGISIPYPQQDVHMHNVANAS